LSLIIPEYFNCKHNLFYALIKVAVQKNAYVDVNPVIVTSEGEIVLAKKTKSIVWGERWHLPEGRTQVNETFEIAFDHGKTVEDTFSILRD